MSVLRYVYLKLKIRYHRARKRYYQWRFDRLKEKQEKREQ